MLCYALCYALSAVSGVMCDVVLYAMWSVVWLCRYVLGAGTYRSAAVNAQLIRYARAAGMREGETAGAELQYIVHTHTHTTMPPTT